MDVKVMPFFNSQTKKLDLQDLISQHVTHYINFLDWSLCRGKLVQWRHLCVLRCSIKSSSYYVLKIAVIGVMPLHGE